MKTHLFVFTGTGNSLWVARQLAFELKDATLEFMPYPSRNIRVEADRVGFIFPVHIWGLPRRVVRFIHYLDVNPDTYLFALAVNAGQPAATLLQFQELLLKRQLSLSLGYSVVMPSNYIPWGGPGPVDTQRQLFSKSLEKVKVIAVEVLGGGKKKVDRGPLWQNILLSWIHRISLRKVFQMDKKFRVDAKCNQCGICLQTCPAQNIKMDNKRLAWLHRCEQCLACLQWCPQEAIQYGKKTPRYTRYHHPEVLLQDILDQAKANKI